MVLVIIDKLYWKIAAAVSSASPNASSSPWTLFYDYLPHRAGDPWVDIIDHLQNLPWIYVYFAKIPGVFLSIEFIEKIFLEVARTVEKWICRYLAILWGCGQYLVKPH